MNGNHKTSVVVVPNILTFLLYVSLFFVLLLAGCGVVPLPDRLAEGKAWQETCPSGKTLATDIRIDASGSQLTDDMPGDLKQILRDAAARTAVCSGRLSVRLFAGSSAGTVVAYDQHLSLPGATENARLLRIKGVQDDVVDAVSNAYRHIEGLRDGSDIVGQFRLSSEFLDQLGASHQLALTVITDGRQGVGAVDPTKAYDQPTARKLVERVDIPLLTGADITIVGLGNVASFNETSAVSESLVRFYRELCEEMQADRCTVATDYVSQVGGEGL